LRRFLAEQSPPILIYLNIQSLRVSTVDDGSMGGTATTLATHRLVPQKSQPEQCEKADERNLAESHNRLSDV